MGQEAPRVSVLDDTHILTMTRTYRDPKLSSMRCGYTFSRGMRFLTCDLSSIYLILAITLTLTIQDAVIGAMRDQSYQVPYFESLEVYKITNPSFPLRRDLSFTFC